MYKPILPLFSPKEKEGGEQDPEPKPIVKKEDKADKPKDDEPKGTLDQEQVNKLTGTARIEGRQAGTKANEEELGMTIKEAKELIAVTEEKRKEELSELDKAKEETELAKQEVADTKADAEKQLEKAKLRLFSAAITAEASKKDYKILSDAISDVWNFVKTEQLEKLEMDDNDTITGMDEAIKLVLEAHPYLVSKVPVPGTPKPKSNSKPPSVREIRTKTRRGGI